MAAVITAKLLFSVTLKLEYYLLILKICPKLSENQAYNQKHIRYSFKLVVISDILLSYILINS